MEKIIISTSSQNSEIYCGEGAFKSFAESVSGQKYFIVTDSNVFSLYGGLISSTFGGAPVHVIRAGEGSKTYTTLVNILKHMLSCGVTRSYTLVALGGGVVGDIGGLAAALYMRGVGLVQIPTTLLAQVDSSCGGKTAVDLNGVKNVIGTFYQPSRVYVDPLCLGTLSKKQLRCGLGEIVKYAAIDGDIYDMVAANRERLFERDFLESVVAPCIRRKAYAVEKDEKDLLGERKALNLGHTTGHAFELYYKRRTHGEYVLIGMYYELYIAVACGICGGQYAEELKKLICAAAGKIPSLPAAEAARLAVYDKKNSEQSEVSLVLPVRRGEWAEFKLPVDEYVGYIRRCALSLAGGEAKNV